MDHNVSCTQIATLFRSSIALRLLMLCCLLWTSAFAQSSSTASLPPQEIHFCAATCVTLYLTTDGLGYSNNRDEQSAPRNATKGVWINRFDSSAVELERADPPTRYLPDGLRGMFSGRIARDGNHVVNGKLTWTVGLSVAYNSEITWGPLLNSIPGAGAAPRVLFERLPWPIKPASQVTEAVAPAVVNLKNNASLRSLPAVIHVCDGFGNLAICMTLELHNDQYVSTSKNEFEPPGFQSVWSFDELSSRAVVMHRHDPPNMAGFNGSHDLDMTYKAQLSPAGTSIVNPTVEGNATPLHMSWGAALSEVAGNNVERSLLVDAKYRADMTARFKQERANQLLLAMPIPSACETKPDVQPIVVAQTSDIPHIALCEFEVAECPGINAGTWTLWGSSGSATWPTFGSIGELTVERFDAQQVVIRMRGLTTNLAGVTSLYTGAMHGNEIDGDVMHTYRDSHVEHRHWHAYIANANESRLLISMQKQINDALFAATYKNMFDVVKLFAGAIQSDSDYRNSPEGRAAQERFNKTVEEQQMLERRNEQDAQRRGQR